VSDWLTKTSNPQRGSRMLVVRYRAWPCQIYQLMPRQLIVGSAFNVNFFISRVRRSS